MHIYNMHIHEGDIKTLYNRVKASAKTRDIHFDLTLTQLNELTFPITCPILGIPLEFHRGRAQDNSVSFDRIDSSIGYTIDNIMIISNRANKLKSDATEDEMRKFAKHMEIT